MDIMIDFNDKSERKGTHELLKGAIKEAGEQIKVECPTGTLKALEKLIETQEKIIEEQEERIAIMSEHGLWIPVEERLPENAQNKGAHCPRYKVYTKWGETEGWYNPDKGCWYFLLWYFAGEKVDFEHGDYPKLAHEINGAKVVTHWMPLSEPPKEGEA